MLLYSARMNQPLTHFIRFFLGALWHVHALAWPTQKLRKQFRPTAGWPRAFQYIADIYTHMYVYMYIYIHVSYANNLQTHRNSSAWPPQKALTGLVRPLLRKAHCKGSNFSLSQAQTVTVCVSAPQIRVSCQMLNWLRTWSAWLWGSVPLLHTKAVPGLEQALLAFAAQGVSSMENLQMNPNMLRQNCLKQARILCSC